MCAQVVPHKVQLMREFFFSGWGGTNTYAAITVWDQESLWIEAVYEKGHRKLCVTAVTCGAFVRIYLSLFKRKKAIYNETSLLQLKAEMNRYRGLF